MFAPSAYFRSSDLDALIGWIPKSLGAKFRSLNSLKLAWLAHPDGKGPVIVELLVVVLLDVAAGKTSSRCLENGVSIDMNSSGGP